jgi:hypothetical protein
VVAGNDGKPTINTTAVDAKKAVSAAQGTDPEGKIRTALAEDAIKRSNDWQAAGLKAQSSIGRLDQLGKMLEQIDTNRFTGSMTDLKAAAKGAGFDLEAMGIKDNVGVAQAARALSQAMALEARDPSSGAGMPGAMSDADRIYLQQMTASITNDPAANKIILATKKADMQRQIDIAKYASEYKRSKAFTNDPAGLDEYVSAKIAAKDYYDPNILPQRSNAPPGAIPSQAPAVRKYNPATGRIE